MKTVKWTETVEYRYVHACNNIPRDANYCPHCGDPMPFSELAAALIERAIIQSPQIATPL